MDITSQLLKAIQNASDRLREIKEKEMGDKQFPGLSIAGLHYLEVIGRMNNPTFMELTGKLGLSKPTVTIMVNKLIQQGYLEKIRSEEDGRYFNILLTEKGQEVDRLARSARSKFADHVKSKLNSQELDTLINLLNRI